VLWKLLQSLLECRASSSALVLTCSSPRSVTKSVHAASRFALEVLWDGGERVERGVVEVIGGWGTDAVPR